MPEPRPAPPAAGEHRRSYIGARLPRREDERLLSDGGCYVADIRRPGMADLAVVRSPFPHAKISAIDLSTAREAPGVLAAICAADLSGLSAIPDYIDRARPVRNFPLMRDRARYVGAPVAAVVATDRYLAEDAAELVEVDYEELPVIATVGQALAANAARLYEDWPDNVMVAVPPAQLTDGRIFERAAKIVRGTYTIQRHGAMPMETRGSVAEYADGRLTLWSSTQLPHILRTMLSTVLRLPESDIRVIAPDVGGAFGCKAELYPEEFLVAALARRLGRPVRYIEDRAEHAVATCHARDMVIDLEAAVAGDGTIQAIRGTIVQDLGSEEVYPPGFAMSLTALGTLTGPYRIAEQSVGVACVVTNKTPAGAYRGFGMPEAVFAMERLIDNVARETGSDGAGLRRRMLLQPGELPYTTASGAILDSGSHAAAYERAVELTGESVQRARADHAGDARIRIGSAVVNYVEGTTGSFLGATGNWTSQDSCGLAFGPDGTVIVRTGVSTGGQGVWTMVATLTAEALGVPVERVRVMLGDTDLTPYGLGGWGSRSTNVFGGALLKAARTVTDKGRVIAAHLLEAAVGDIVAEDGVFHVAGSPQPRVSWADVARAAYVRTVDLPPGVDPGLEATAFYDPPVDQGPHADGKINACLAYTNASQGVVVSVDVDTGEVRVIDYLVIHDCGTVINPMIVEGQIHGGVAQGIGGALYEHLVYSPDGQPLATTFMDYIVPSATEIPPIIVEHLESPSPRTAFGAKGAGEAGLIGPAAAIAAAVEDALAEFGVPQITATPLQPSVVLRLIDSGRSAPA